MCSYGKVSRGLGSPLLYTDTFSALTLSHRSWGNPPSLHYEDKNTGIHEWRPLCAVGWQLSSSTGSVKDSTLPKYFTLVKFLYTFNLLQYFPYLLLKIFTPICTFIVPNLYIVSSLLKSRKTIYGKLFEKDLWKNHINLWKTCEIKYYYCYLWSYNFTGWSTFKILLWNQIGVFLNKFVFTTRQIKRNTYVIAKLKNVFTFWPMFTRNWYFCLFVFVWFNYFQIWNISPEF